MVCWWFGGWRFAFSGVSQDKKNTELVVNMRDNILSRTALWNPSYENANSHITNLKPWISGSKIVNRCHPLTNYSALSQFSPWQHFSHIFPLFSHIFPNIPMVFPFKPPFCGSLLLVRSELAQVSISVSETLAGKAWDPSWTLWASCGMGDDPWKTTCFNVTFMWHWTSWYYVDILGCSYRIYLGFYGDCMGFTMWCSWNSLVVTVIVLYAIFHGIWGDSVATWWDSDLFKWMQWEHDGDILS